MKDISFDVLSELRLQPEESFNWEGKQTSLYCLVPGNVSKYPRTVVQTLSHLTNHYQGVFYVPGNLEFELTPFGLKHRVEELCEIVSQIPNVVILYQHVVIVDGVAILGINGWADGGDETTQDGLLRTELRLEDTIYLRQSIQRLQKHLDVKKILIMSNGVPNTKLYYGEEPEITEYQVPLDIALEADTENKVVEWVFGSYDKAVDISIDNIHYVNNPYVRKSPYWSKRISV